MAHLVAVSADDPCMGFEASEAKIEYVLRRRAILISVRSGILTGGLIAGAVLALIGGGPGSLAAAIFTGVLAVALLVATLQTRRKLTKRLTVSSRGLDVWPLSGQKVSMKWGEISSVGVQSSPTVDGAHRYAVIIARDRRWIVFTDMISDFDDLVARIESSATSRDPIPHRLSRRDRLLLLG